MKNQLHWQRVQLLSMDPRCLVLTIPLSNFIKLIMLKLNLTKYFLQRNGKVFKPNNLMCGFYWINLQFNKFKEFKICVIKKIFYFQILENT